MAMSRVLIVGATRGLGASLIKQYASRPATTPYGTARSGQAPDEKSGGDFPSNIKWLTGIDLMKEDAADKVVGQLSDGSDGPLSAVIISAGHFTTESLDGDGPNWSEEVRMYTTSSVAPVFLVHRLVRAGLLGRGSRVVLVSSEAGSVGLRHAKEGGGNYAHHASKAALNMAGRLLSLDLAEREVVVSIVHPGFMRTEMTAGVGFDKYWDDGGAVTPDEAAKSLIDWTDKLDMSKSGEYWAPRGPRDIGTAEATMGDNLPTPLKLPW